MTRIPSTPRIADSKEWDGMSAAKASEDDKAAELLAKRTLTNLYNERPTWLDLAHRKLDEAVFAAYDWEPTLTDDEILARLLALNQQRSAAEEG